MYMALGVGEQEVKATIRHNVRDLGLCTNIKTKCKLYITSRACFPAPITEPGQKLSNDISECRHTKFLFLLKER